jgi:hypothetical protein
MLDKIKDKLKFKLAKVLTPEIHKRLAVDEKFSSVDQKIITVDEKFITVNEKFASVQLFQIAPWYEENHWEPPVQIILRDLCKPGDVVFGQTLPA